MTANTDVGAIAIEIAGGGRTGEIYSRVRDMNGDRGLEGEMECD